MKIAVVGAPGTGKSTLVRALRQALQADADMESSTVTELQALQPQHPYELTLLLGLDLPQHGKSTLSVALQADADLRSVLSSQSIAYTVVYGIHQARTDCAMQAIAYRRALATKRPTATSSAWHWNCETCSDADCEHRLFSALLKKDASVRQ
jgi:GTPase SAR1 family protein